MCVVCCMLNFLKYASYRKYFLTMFFSKSYFQTYTYRPTRHNTYMKNYCLIVYLVKAFSRNTVVSTTRKIFGLKCLITQTSYQANALRWSIENGMSSSYSFLTFYEKIIPKYKTFHGYKACNKIG